MRRYFPGSFALPTHPPSPPPPNPPPETAPTTSPPASPSRPSILPSVPNVRGFFLFSQQPRRNSEASASEPHLDPVSSNLPELCRLVDTNLGPLEDPSECLSVRIPTDQLAVTLTANTQERNRLLRQFLRARQCNAQEALRMLTTTLHWRKQVTIENYLVHSIRNMIMPSACFPMHIISHPDKCKQPVVYGLIRLLDKKKAERGPFQNALLSFLETVYFGHSYIMDDMIIILDFRDWSIRRNAPYRLVKDGIQTLQANYPERLGRVFLVNYPTSIRAAYTAISPIIDPGAKEKIVWIADADPSETLLKYVPSKSIPTFLGGQLEAVFPESWPDIAAEFQADQTSTSHGLFHHH